MLQALHALPRPRRQAASTDTKRSAVERRVWTIPAPVRGFTGRIEALAEMEAARRAGEPTAVQALTGMGGVGKTTAVIEYAHRHHDRFDIAWWVPAEDPALAAERLAELAVALDLTTATDPTGAGVARARGELARRGGWLVVFDNAEDPRALLPLLPEGPGHVLITSRNPAWRGIAATIEMREFTRAESVALLQRRAPELTAIEADRVAEAMGDLPLAIEQAGSLLVDTGMTVDKYLRLLAERAPEVLDHDTGGAYPHSIAASWAVAFDRLTLDDTAARDLLTLLAWFAPEPVPLSVITEHIEVLPDLMRPIATDPLVLARCTAILHRRGMVTVSPHGIHLHRIPAALLRARTEIADAVMAEVCAATVVRLLDRTAPTSMRIDPNAWPLWRRLLPHLLVAGGRDAALDAAPLEATRLLDRAAAYLLTRGELHAALAPFERAYDARQRRLGEDHPDTLSSASNLALNLELLGEHQRARALDQDTLIRRRRVLGEEMPDTLVSASQLAVDLYALGDHREARQLQEETVGRQRRILGDDHPSTLMSASSLGLLMWSGAGYQEARQLEVDTLARCHAILGDDHPQTLATAGFLSLVLLSLGDYRQAHRLQDDTYSRSRRVLGEDHPTTLYCASVLGMVLWSSGEHEEACRLQSDTFSRSERVLGADHLITLEAASHLGLVLWSLGDYQQAYQVENSTVIRYRRTLGEDHPETLLSASRLGLILSSLGKRDQARQLQSDTLVRLRRVQGDDHPDTLMSASWLAADLRELGEVQQARALDVDVLARRRRVLGEGHPDTIAAARKVADDEHA